MKLLFFRTVFVMLALLLGTSDAVEAQGTYRGGLVTPPLPKPGFTLTDTSGSTFDFRLRPRDTSRSSFSDMPTAPMCVHFTWRTSP